MLDLKPYLQAVPEVNEGVPERIEADLDVLGPRAAIIRGLPLLPVRPAILCVGAAAGWELRQLAQRYPGARVTGLTPFSEEAEAVHANGMSAVVGDMHKMPTKWSKYFDLVFVSHVLEHSPAPYVALSEVARVLKPRGYVCVVMPEPAGTLHTGNERTKRLSDMKHHIFCASIETLIFLLRKTGLHFEAYREVAQYGGGHLNYWHRVFLARRPI